MGSASAILTMGLGDWGSVNEIITLGLGTGGTPTPTPTPYYAVALGASAPGGVALDALPE